MSFGCNVPVFGPLATPENMMSLARRADELGFDHLWVSDHIVLPNQIAPRYPYDPTGVPPFMANADQPWCEPLTALSFLASCTQRIKLGTTVLVVPYREPVLTAKMVATLDYMSGGRVILGVGVGWMEEEFNILGLDTFHERGKVTDEYLRIYKELWTQEDPSFQGTYAQFSGIKFYPKPVQEPHPPIWVGGNTVPALRRAARLGDGWLPTGAEMDLETMAGHIQRLRDMTEQAGRPRDEVDVAKSMPRGDASAEEFSAQIRSYQQIGVKHFMINMGSESRDQVLDGMEHFATEVRPLLPTD